MPRFILDVLTPCDKNQEYIDEVWKIFDEHFGGMVARLTIIDKTNDTTLHVKETDNMLTEKQINQFNDELKTMPDRE